MTLYYYFNLPSILYYVCGWIGSIKYIYMYVFTPLHEK